jgi:hypothetical protein
MHMKTTWQNMTLRRGRSPREVCEWLQAKKAELECETGVAWSHEPANDTQRFHPYMRKVDAEWTNQPVGEKMLIWLKGQYSPVDGGYRTLLNIAETLRLDLLVVCGTAWVLSQRGLVNVTVDRMGMPTAIGYRTTLAVLRAAPGFAGVSNVANITIMVDEDLPQDVMDLVKEHDGGRKPVYFAYEPETGAVVTSDEPIVDVNVLLTAYFGSIDNFEHKGRARLWRTKWHTST